MRENIEDFENEFVQHYAKLNPKWQKKERSVVEEKSKKFKQQEERRKKGLCPECGGKISVTKLSKSDVLIAKSQRHFYCDSCGLHLGAMNIR